MSCALKTDGTVWCWGLGTNGDLGNGSITDSLIPVQVSGLSNVSSISVESVNACAVKADGTLWCWGADAYGALGDGNQSVLYTTPAQVSGISNVSKVRMGSIHSCAVKTDGTVWCWGWNYEGEIGNGGYRGGITLPTQASGLTSATVAEVGIRVSLAVKSDGTVW